MVTQPALPPRCGVVLSPAAQGHGTADRLPLLAPGVPARLGPQPPGRWLSGGSKTDGRAPGLTSRSPASSIIGQGRLSSQSGRKSESNVARTARALAAHLQSRGEGPT